MTRLRLGLSHLREHKFNHNFQNCINPLCSCAMDIESTSHFFVHCPLFDDKTITLLSTLNKVNCKLIETNEYPLIETLLFGNSLFDFLKKLPHSFLIIHWLHSIYFKILSTTKSLTLTNFNNFYYYKYSCRSNRIHLSFQNYLIYYIYI